MLTRLLAVALAGSLALTACSSSNKEGASPPTSVGDAELAGSGVSAALRIGTVVNVSAPTADADARQVAVLESAADQFSSSTVVSIESVRIRSVDDVDPAIQALRELGVTVIVTLCDDATVPALAQAGIDAELLVVSGCASLPRPQLDVDSPFFIDAAGLTDDAAAIASWIGATVDSDASQIGVFSSDLVPDVAATCDSAKRLIADDDVAAIGLDSTFTGLVDDAAAVAASVADRATELDALVICALPPFAGDLVDALRAIGFDQPVVTPWFTDAQRWSATTNDVSVLVPASRHGDDPSSAVMELYESLDDPSGVDVVAADTMALLIGAAERTGSASPSRLGALIRADPVDAFSGDIDVVGDPAHVERAYRVLRVDGGEISYDDSISP